MKITKEIKVAVLVILSIVLFYWGFNFLKGKNLFDTSNKLYVEYTNVAGLAPASPVTINGLAIGKVNKIEVKDDGKMLVEMVITNEEVKISKSSIAEIQGAGLMGGREIAIINNFKDKNFTNSGDYLKAGEKLGLTDALAKELVPVKDKVEVLIENASKLFTSLNNTLDKKTQDNLKASLASLEVTLKEFSETSKNLNALVAENRSKLSSTLTNFDKTSNNLVKISDSLSKANLAGTVKNLEKTLNNVNGIMQNLEKGNGTMGKLLKDEALYTNLEKTSKELELLLQDLRLNPTRYVNVSVFGKKNKPYVAPKENETEIKNKTN